MSQKSPKTECYQWCHTIFQGIWYKIRDFCDTLGWTILLQTFWPTYSVSVMLVSGPSGCMGATMVEGGEDALELCRDPPFRVCLPIKPGLFTSLTRPTPGGCISWDP